MGAVCEGGKAAVRPPFEMSHTNISPALPPDTIHLPQTENASVNIGDWKKLYH